MTDFLPVRRPSSPRTSLTSREEHPGGAEVILKYAGRDATSVYEPIHPPDALDKNLPTSKHLGVLTSDAAERIGLQRRSLRKTRDEQRTEEARQRLPPLSRILSLMDMEVCRLLVDSA